jgi:hypothetical protein
MDFVSEIKPCKGAALDNDLTNLTENVYPMPRPTQTIDSIHPNRAWHTLREASYGQKRVDKTKHHLPNAAPLR